MRKSPTPVSAHRCVRQVKAAQLEGYQWVGLVTLQVQEPTDEDEYEVCDPDNSEY